MENNLNTKKENKSMGKILLFFTVLTYLMFSSFAGTVIYNQDTSIANFEEEDIGTQLFYTIVGSDNSKTLGNRTGDLKLEFNNLYSDVYLIIDNPSVNTTLNISWLFSGATAIITQELTMSEIGEYYFQVKNHYDGESGSILLEMENPSVAPLYVQTTQDVKSTSIFTPLIAGVVELITINLTLWRVMFYLFITLVTIIAIGSLFYIGFRLIKYSKTLNKDGFRKHSQSNHGGH